MNEFGHAVWLAANAGLHKAYLRRRRAWSKSINWPWPKSPEDITPPPGTLDLPVNYPEG